MQTFFTTRQPHVKTYFSVYAFPLKQTPQLKTTQEYLKKLYDIVVGKVFHSQKHELLMNNNNYLFLCYQQFLGIIDILYYKKHHQLCSLIADYILVSQFLFLLYLNYYNNNKICFVLLSFIYKYNTLSISPSSLLCYCIVYVSQIKNINTELILIH